MTLLLVAAGAVVALGAGVAVGARDVRVATGGALLVLVLAPFLADPLPVSSELAFRLVAGVLAAFLLLVASRRASDEAVPALGLPATIAAAAAAFAAGLGATAVGLPTFGPTAALAAGLACLAVAVAPIARGGSGFRLGAALVMLLEGGLLLHGGFVGTPPGLETLVAGVALACLAGAAVTLAAAAATAAGEPAGAGDPARPQLPVAADHGPAAAARKPAGTRR